MDCSRGWHEDLRPRMEGSKTREHSGATHFPRQHKIERLSNDLCLGFHWRMHGGPLGRRCNTPDSERPALEADAVARPALGDAMTLSEEELHAIAHARYQVKRATPENPDCCFDYGLVADLIKVIDRGLAAQGDPIERLRKGEIVTWASAGALPSSPALCTASHNSGERDPSVMPGYGAGEAIFAECAEIALEHVGAVGHNISHDEACRDIADAIRTRASNRKTMDVIADNRKGE